MKQFCVHGHDTFVVGRYSDNGMCKQCRKQRVAAYEKQRGKEWVAAKKRRAYQVLRLDPVKYTRALASTQRWREANPERYRLSHRKTYEKYRGVNFWVVAASKSR